MSWRNMHPLNVTGMGILQQEEESIIDYFAYSQLIRKGIIIENNYDETLQNNLANIMLFDVDTDEYLLYNFKRYYNVSTPGKIVKADITNERMFIILTTSNTMQILQIFEDVIKPVSSSVWEQNNFKILDFDTFEMQYLIVYYDNSVTDVYQFESSVELTHRMRLPKYSKYEKFVFKDQKREIGPNRVFFEKTLALVMTNPEENQTAYLIYKLDEPQHNSLYLSNFNTVLRDSKFLWILLAANSEDLNTHYLGIVSDNRFELIQMKYFDTISVDMSKNQELLNRCKHLLNDKDEAYPKAEIIDVIDIAPKSTMQQEIQTAQKLSLSISSMNHGLAILPQRQQTLNIGYSESLAAAQSSNLQVMIGSFLQGFNMDYSSNCIFKGPSGESINCTNTTVQSLMTYEYNFPISFVTAATEVVHSFPLDRYYLMMDTSGRIRIEILPSNYDSDPTQTQKPPLDKIAVWDQKWAFGCFVNDSSQFAKIIRVNTTKIDPKQAQQYSDRSLYLLFYQCINLKSGLRELSALEIAIFKKSKCLDNDENCVWITPIKNVSQIIYDVIDIELVNLTLTISDKEPDIHHNLTNMTSMFNYKFDLVLICEITISYSNLFLVYNNAEIYTINSQLKSFRNIELSQWNSAARRLWDTFKPQTVTIIPDSKFILVSMDGFGALFYHTGRNQIVFELNVTDTYRLQDLQFQQKYGNVMKVYDVQINYPNHVYIFTNQGFVIYEFDIPMSHETEILGAPEMYKPRLKIIQHFPYNVLNAKVVGGPYGFILLFETPIGRNSYQTIMQAVTYFQDKQSKLYKTVNLNPDLKQLKCQGYSFYRSEMMEKLSEDELAVSVVCNQRLRAVRFCLRPSVDLQLKQYIDKELNSVNGRLGFNNFSLLINASNQYSSGEVNKVQVEVQIWYQLLPGKKITSLTTIIFFTMLIMSTVLFLFMRTRAAKSEQKEDLRKQLRDYDNKLLEQRKSTFIFKYNDLFENFPRTESVNEDKTSFYQGFKLDLSMPPKKPVRQPIRPEYLSDDDEDQEYTLKGDLVERVDTKQSSSSSKTMEMLLQKKRSMNSTQGNKNQVTFGGFGGPQSLQEKMSLSESSDVKRSYQNDSQLFQNANVEVEYRTSIQDVSQCDDTFDDFNETNSRK